MVHASACCADVVQLLALQRGRTRARPQQLGLICEGNAVLAIYSQRFHLLNFKGVIISLHTTGRIVRMENAVAFCMETRTHCYVLGFVFSIPCTNPRSVICTVQLCRGTSNLSSHYGRGGGVCVGGWSVLTFSPPMMQSASVSKACESRTLISITRAISTDRGEFLLCEKKTH